MGRMMLQPSSRRLGQAFPALVEVPQKSNGGFMRSLVVTTLIVVMLAIIMILLHFVLAI